jgi:hypothetical protein
VFIATANGSENGARIFAQPGLLIFTTIGNILLFRLLWASNAFLWKENHVNYVHLLNLGITHPNPYSLLEETSTFFMLYCINLIIYMQSESSYPGRATNNIWPLLLVFTVAVFAINSYRSKFNQKGKVKESTGSLFDQATLQRCFSAPMVAVTFRDVFAADVLTSFTKPMSDGVFGACWLFSGAFLRDDQSQSAFGSSYIECKGHTVVLFATVFIVAVPFLIRFLQCVRDGYDKGTWYPQALNALKYLSAMLLVLYGLANDKHSWAYYFLVLFNSLYKWWWDVVMDWDLFHIHFSNGMPLLRNEMLYSPPIQYYAAILVDLILRFVWVMSLAPTYNAISVLNSSQFNFFFGSLEIIWRFLGGLFRMEYEHIKHIKKKAIGYTERRQSVIDKSHTATSKKALMVRTKSVRESVRDRMGKDIYAESKIGSDVCLYPHERNISLQESHVGMSSRSKVFPVDGGDDDVLPFDQLHETAADET